MAAKKRAMWKAVLRIGDASVPVKLYSAVEDRTVHFHLLHDRDHERVRQRMVNPVDGHWVPREETRRGYEVEDGVFVVLEDEELQELEPPPSREIEIVRFVDPAEIDHRWYERPYWLGPDGEAAAPRYFALAEALARKGKEGVARWVMRKKPYVGALWAEGGYLALISLRHAGEIVPISALEPPRGRSLEPRELGMAEQLVGALEDEFDPALYHDEYRERVLELIEAKAEGRSVEVPEVEREPARASLASALEESLSRMRKGA